VSGRFIVLEGGDASGKSTQAARLAATLGAVLTREPGGTEVGERIRSLLLDPLVDSLDAKAEALLMAAARAEHVASVIRPALAAGRDVVSDRYAGSSLAYQGYGRGLLLADVRWLSATGVLWPDLTVLLSVSAADVASRQVRSGGSADRLEAEGDGFQQRVAAGFAALAAGDPTWRVVDGSRTVDEVAARVLQVVTDFFGRSLGP
jgi:dTMP kinase